MQWIRSHLSFANAISLIALFVALGGTSVAAVTLTKNSVGAKQIKKNAVRASEIKRNAVGASGDPLQRRGQRRHRRQRHRWLGPLRQLGRSRVSSATTRSASGEARLNGHGYHRGRSTLEVGPGCSRGCRRTARFSDTGLPAAGRHHGIAKAGEAAGPSLDLPVRPAASVARPAIRRHQRNWSRPGRTAASISGDGQPTHNDAPSTAPRPATRRPRPTGAHLCVQFER